jgi:ABC-2 type transport system ATP-binding protein
LVFARIAMAAIEILDLEKSYLVGFWRKRPKLALRPLRLTIEEGEVFGFLGPNGAGKTTTLKLLMGLVFPTAGSARILGMDMDDPKVKSQIGFLPEQPYFYDHLSAANCSTTTGSFRSSGKRPLGARRANADARGIERFGGDAIAEILEGHVAAVGLAQAILHDPKLVFLDEPMSGLDPMGRREVRDLIQQLRHEGKTVFFSTHILSDAEALCDRVGVIHQGELRGVGAVVELTSRNKAKSKLFFAHQSAGGFDEPRRRGASQRRYGERGIAGRAAGCRARSAAPRAPQTDFAHSGAPFARGVLHPETAPHGRPERKRRRPERGGRVNSGRRNRKGVSA